MTPEELKQKVEQVIECAGDDETAHSMEDNLHIELINEFCPEWVRSEVKRLSEADFCRWCA